MKNFIQEGEYVELTVNRDVKSGGGFLAGSLFGVAVGDVANDGTGNFKLSGVFTLPALSTSTFTQGAKAYWDNSDGKLHVTNAASGNTLIGEVLEAKTSGGTTAVVRLRS